MRFCIKSSRIYAKPRLCDCVVCASVCLQFAITVGRVFNVIPLTFVANLKRRTKIPRKFQAMMIYAGMFMMCVTRS